MRMGRLEGRWRKTHREGRRVGRAGHRGRRTGSKSFPRRRHFPVGVRRISPMTPPVEPILPPIGDVFRPRDRHRPDDRAQTVRKRRAKPGDAMNRDPEHDRSEHQPRRHHSQNAKYTTSRFGRRIRGGRTDAHASRSLVPTRDSVETWGHDGLTRADHRWTRGARAQRRRPRLP